MPASRNRYRAAAHHHGRIRHIGYFKNPVAAALAYDEWSLRNAGPFPQVNFHRRVSRKYTIRKLRTYRGGIVRIIFRKRTTGSFRWMLARVPQGNHHPRAPRGILVHEMPYPRWRIIPHEGILAFKIKGVFYAVASDS